ncbi:ABC transporter ATP-binding protein [Brevibacterium sp. UMB10442]|nr:ABC transporter ATP-binding protein [Brevibacterium sp. UMB10442]
MTTTSHPETAATPATPAEPPLPATLRDAIREQRPALLAAGLLAVMSATCSLAPYLAVYAVAVALFVDDAPGRIPAIAGWTAAALVVRALTSAASEHLAHTATYRMLRRLRLRIVQTLQSIPLGRVQARSAGQLTKTLHDDVEQLEEAFAHGVPDGSAAAAIPLATTAVLFAVDWRLALVALAALVLLILVSAVGMTLAQRNNAELAAHATVLTRAVMGYLHGIVVIRGYLRTGSAFDHARAAVLRGADLQLKAASGPERWLVAAMSVATTLAIALLLPAAGLSFTSGRIDAGTLVLVLLLGLGYLTPIIGLVGTLATILTRIQLAAASVTALLEEPPLPAPAHPAVPTRFDVAFEDVSFAYREDTPVLTSVTLRVPAGTSLALVGATGSGKSTLARLLARFHDVAAGRILIGGVDVRDIAPAHLARLVAFVQQDEHVFAATLRENIRIARPAATDAEVVTAAEAAQLSEVAAALPQGWDTPLPAGGGTLSGGQRQRIAIARALLKDARIIVLDEATASLDAATECRTLEAIDTLTRDRTVLAIAHRLTTIRDSDSIAYLEAGTVAAQGDHDNLLEASAGYRDLWRAYTKATGWRLEPVARGCGTTSDEVAAVASPGHGTERLDPGHLAADGGDKGPAPSDDLGDPSNSDHDRSASNGLGDGDPAAIVRPGLGRMSFARQWRTLYGHAWRPLLTRGLPRMVAESLLRGAPLIAVVVVVLAAIGALPQTGLVGAGGIGAESLGTVLLNAGLVRTVTILLAVALVLRLLASMWMNGLIWTLAARAKADLQLSVLDRLRRVPLGLVQRLEPGRVGTTVTSDAALIDFQNVPQQVVGALVQPVLATVILLLVDWRLALAALVGLPLFWAATAWSDRVYHRVFADVHTARHTATAAMLEQARGAAVLRSNPDSAIARRYRTAMEDLESASVAMSVRATPSLTVATIAIEAGQVVLILVGSALFAAGAVPATTHVLFLFLTLTLYQPIQELGALAGYRRNQQQIAARIAEVWDAPALPEPTSPTAPAGTDVELRNVTFAYEAAEAGAPAAATGRPGTAGDTGAGGGHGLGCSERTVALRSASFVARAGEVTALVGASGSGKSTIAHLIARYWDVDAGGVLIGGTDVRELGSEAVFDAVATVFQDVYLFDESVRFNVTLGAPHATDAQVWEALVAAQCDDVVQALPQGLDTVLADGGADLSGGQRQRLAIARALLKDSPILILDEAASAVDPGTEERLQRALATLTAGRTVLVIAHRIRTVENADRIVVVDDGRIAGIGTHAHLLDTCPAYRTLAQAQAGVSDPGATHMSSKEETA